jgi:serine/threonine protein kinase
LFDASGGESRHQQLIAAARRQFEQAVHNGLPVGGSSNANPLGGAPALHGRPSLPGYEILREVHRGGQGVVYQAIQQSTGRTVAVKVLREGPFAGGSDRLRFEREVSILAQLKHRSIIGILDRGDAAGNHYLVMDFVEGRPLDRHARECNLSLNERLELFARVCDAVSAAHLRGVIHRDLKPGNILVDAAGDPWILDFGLAKSSEDDSNLAQTATRTGQFVGSLAWAAPEQAMGLLTEVDIRSDVYSLGVMLYQLMTDRLPYSTVGDLAQALTNIRSAEPIRPSTLSPEIDDDLETIVLKCLAKEPARRYQSVGELARDVRHRLNNEPVEAKRDSGWYVLSKTIQKYKVGVAVAAAFVVLSTASAIALSVLYSRSRTLVKDLETSSVKTRTEAEKSRQIAQFAQGMLSGIDPATAGDMDKKLMHKVLDDAAARVESELSDTPEVEAAIRLTIGDTYRVLGEYAAAEPHVARALELRRQVLGNESEDTLKAMAVAASVSRFAGRYETAEQLYREWYETSRRVLGEEYPGTLTAMNNLSTLYQNTGRSQEAESLLSRALEVQRRSLGDEHASTLITRANLGDVYRSLRRYDEAEAILKQVLEAQRRLFGREHPDTLVTLNTLVRVYNQSGRPADAEPLCRELLKARRRVLGNEHPLTLNATNELGYLYLNQSRLDDAEPLFANAIEIQRHTLGEEHADTLASRLNLARVMFERRQLSRAEELLSPTLAGLRRTLGELHPHTLSAANGLGMIYTAMARPADAERIYRELLTIHRSAQPADEMQVSTGIGQLLPTLLVQGKYVEAETLTRECLEIRQRLLPPEDPRQFSGMSMLGEAIAGQSRFAEAEPLLLESNEKLQNSSAAETIKRMAFDRIVKLYDAWDTAEPGTGKAELAAQWRAKIPTSQPVTRPAA